MSVNRTQAMYDACDSAWLSSGGGGEENRKLQRASSLQDGCVLCLTMHVIQCTALLLLITPLHTLISHTHFTHSFHTLISHTHFTHSFHTLISHTHFTHSFHTLISRTHFTHSFHALTSRTHFTHSLHALTSRTHFTHSLHTLTSHTHFTPSIHREDIASCSEAAYSNLRLADAQKLMMFKSSKEAEAYAKQVGGCCYCQ
jgi:hypothetical protein